VLDKVALLLKGKAAAGVVALVLAGSGGTAVAVAAQTHSGPFANTHASAASTGDANSQAQGHGSSGDSHAHTVAIEGVLKIYDAGAKTIGVQKNGETSTTTISVNGQTTVNGDQATTLADLANNLNHRVQVQADQQSDNSLVAWKITVGGPADPNASDGNGGNGDNQGQGSNNGGAGSGSTGQQPLVGTVSSVDPSASTFILKETDGTLVTVTVSNATLFQGSAHSLADLKATMHVTVKGAKQADGTLSATSIQVGA
jgi:Domain of unknown function (DUF5666)